MAYEEEFFNPLGQEEGEEGPAEETEEGSGEEEELE